jgi:hypothetical protein
MRTTAYLRLAATLAAWLSWGPLAHAANVDVAIVFAVDFSSSIDPQTADLQRKGHAAALTSPEVTMAIAGNYLGCIAIIYFEWSSPGRSRVVLPWTKICNPADAEAAARAISEKGFSGFSRRARAGTSVSSAIDLGAYFLDNFPGKADRKVIDISANGTNNDGFPVQPSRLNAVAKGYTINAIAIPNQEEAQLASYFAANVIGGPRAFVISPTGPDDYAIALRRKLVTEISMNIDPEGLETISR